jgi:N-acetyl-gamma-glutamyl-phosphate reductase
MTGHRDQTRQRNAMSDTTMTLSTPAEHASYGAPHAGAGRAAAASSSRQCRFTAAVVGGSGYTGALLAELLLRHPSFSLTALSSDTQAGTPVVSVLPRVRSALSFCRNDDVAGIDAAFVCLPDGAAAPVVKRLLDEGSRVVDLSPDFRLGAQAYAEWYGEHPYPEMLPGVYGLTELNRDRIAGAQLVANPGCYPTAALLALDPLRQLGLLDVVIDAKSGVSGAGKTPSEKTHFCSIDSDLLVYAMAGHRHYPELAAGLAINGNGPSLTFQPHVVPLQRGILETIYVRAEQHLTAGELRRLYRTVYAGERFVEVCDEPPRLRDVAGTNYCRVSVTVDERAGRIVLVAAIDNLLKGACGQALQNMNVMLGLPEQEGLL